MANTSESAFSSHSKTCQENLIYGGSIDHQRARPRSHRGIDGVHPRVFDGACAPRRHFLGFRSPGNTFAVLIQLGAILAILLVYFQRLLSIALALPTSVKARRFVVSVLLAFLPAAIIGAIAHDFIKTVLFETPILICVVLIIGGFILLAIDRMPLTPRYTDVMDYPPSLALKIGLFQCLAMIPGTSRSGATIAGALLMGTDKRSRRSSRSSWHADDARRLHARPLQEP